MVPIHTGTRHGKSRSSPRLLHQHREHCGERQIDTRVPVATVGMMPLRQQSIPIRAGSTAQVVPVKKAETKTNAAPAVSPERPRRDSANYFAPDDGDDPSARPHPPLSTRLTVKDEKELDTRPAHLGHIQRERSAVRLQPPVHCTR